MKRFIGIVLLSALLLTGCNSGKEKAEYQEPQSQTAGAFGSGNEFVSPGSFFNELVGYYQYERCSLDGRDGFLVIEADPEVGGIAISDYFDAGRQYYRFLGCDSYCDKVVENRAYMRYPETVFEDDTAVYSYYIFEAEDQGVSVYFSYDSFDAAQLIYTARKVQ